MKLVIVDLDGTLFDTKDVNYHAYKDAITPYGYDIDYKYYCDFCNGRHYKEFLPQMGYSAAHSVDFEVYYGSDRPGLFCELWIPICKK